MLVISGQDLVAAKIEIAQEDTSLGHLDGHLSDNFWWSLEFDRLVGKDALTLCVRHGWIREMVHILEL